MGEVVEVDSNGRIVIPISIRDKLGIENGVRLVLEIKGDEIVLTRLVEEQ
jgi:AbrB family looped-hinge helix DNA binding protein